MQRKMFLVIKTCDPREIDDALVGLYTSWISVVCTLKIQFARTITLALSIADFLEKPCDKFLAPAIIILIPKGFQTF